MADKKRDLGSLLGGESSKPPIRRGQGMRLSTEPAPPEAPVQEETDAETQKRENAGSQKRIGAETQKRINRGYALREDLVKACKRIALEDDRNLYEVMEEALEQYITRWKEAQQQGE
jgi:hypothetical protein